MSATDESAARRPSSDKSDKKGGRGRSGGAGQKSGNTAGKHPPGELGRALKTVYDDTLREDVPKDFLDLLGKLS